MAIDYQRLTETSVQQLSNLVRARRNIDAEILKIQRRVRSNAAQLCQGHKGSGGFAVPSSHPGSLGVTEAVRQVLYSYPIWLAAVSIRNLLPSIGFDFKRYKHPLTTIHSVLRRLVAGGEVIRTAQPQAGTSYIWAEYFPMSRSETILQAASVEI
jgi:hypothetical protein